MFLAEEAKILLLTIDNKKISTQEFVIILNQLNLNDRYYAKDLKKTDLIEKILSEYIGKKVKLEMEDLGITVSDNFIKKFN